MAKYLVYLTGKREEDGTMQFSAKPVPGKEPALLDPELDRSGLPYTDENGGWASEEAFSPVGYKPWAEYFAAQ